MQFFSARLARTTSLVAVGTAAFMGCTSRTLGCNELGCTAEVIVDARLPPPLASGYQVRVCWESACATAQSDGGAAGTLQGRAAFAPLPEGGPDQGFTFEVEAGDGGLAAPHLRIILSSGAALSKQTDLQIWVTGGSSGSTLLHTEQHVDLGAMPPDRCGFSCQRATVTLE